MRRAAATTRCILQNLVKDSGQELVLKQAVVAALAGTRTGSVWLLDAHDKKELPEAVQPAVARLLRNSPYVDLRNRALIAFPPPNRLDLKKLPDIATLAKRKGDAVLGKVIEIDKDRKVVWTFASPDLANMRMRNSKLFAGLPVTMTTAGPAYARHMLSPTCSISAC